MTGKRSKFMLLNKASRKKNRDVLNQLEDQSPLIFDEVFSEVSDKWEERARKIQARRWRRIKQQVV